MYKIIAEIQPASCFGLPEDNKIVWPAPDVMLKILKDSSSNILFKVSKYRDHSDAIIIEYESLNFHLKIDDNYIIFHSNSASPNKALDFCQGILNKFIRLLQFKFAAFFYYRIIEMYLNNGFMPLPKTGRVDGGNFAIYNLKQLKDNLNFSLQNINIEDKKALRFLDYFDRAIFLENIYNDHSERHLNERFYYFLLPEIFLNFYKSISTIIGDPSIDNDYQKRYRKLGFDEDYFKLTLEVLRDVRNNKDISHYTLNENLKIYYELQKFMPKIKKTANEVFERYLKTLSL